MVALCTTDDVAAVSGYPVSPDDTPRVERLIELASANVAANCIPLPGDGTVPDVVASVTAQLVVRQMANPAAARVESIGAHRAAYTGPGLVLTEADHDQLGPWAKPQTGARAYSVWTPSPYAVDDYTSGDFVAFDHDDFWVQPLPEGDPAVEVS